MAMTASVIILRRGVAEYGGGARGSRFRASRGENDLLRPGQPDNPPQRAASEQRELLPERVLSPAAAAARALCHRELAPVPARQRHLTEATRV